MSKVILDGWTLHRAFYQLSIDADNSIGVYDSDMENLCLGNLLTGIILWENLTWISDKYVNHCYNRLHKTDSAKKMLSLFSISEAPDFEIFNSVLPDSEFWERSNNTGEACDEDMEEVYKRTELYLKWGANSGTNYFPHPKRAKYISENQLMEKANREVIMGAIDRNIHNEYYQALNKKYGRFICNLNFPVLFDYIRKEYQSPLDRLSMALDLRDNTDIQDFRNSLDDLDDALNSGKDIHVLDKAIAQIEAHTKYLRHKYSKTIEGQINIGWLPSVLINFKHRVTPKILNLTFLEKFIFQN